MVSLYRLKQVVLILILLPIFQSCAEKKDLVPQIDPVKDTSQTPSQTSTQAAKSVKKPKKTMVPVTETSPTSIQASVQAVDLAEKHMEKGEYQKAIDVYNAEYRKNTHNQTLVKAYVKSIENIKSSADNASYKKDFASAGRNYNLLLKNFPRFKGLKKTLSFDSTHLNEKLCYCKNAISKQGFQEYRKGNLSGAIFLWEALLAIDPHNTEIKKSLGTAKLQQKNLGEN